jgi:hypothetical protein
LNQSVKDCKTEYDKLILKKPEAKFLALWDRAKNSEILGEWLSDVIKSRGMDKDDPLKDPGTEGLCRAFVLAMISPSSGHPSRLRTYSLPTDLATIECTISQAALAAAALSCEFEPVTFGEPLETYFEAGLGYGNPARVACNEAELIWPLSIRCLVNIGTGFEPPHVNIPVVSLITRPWSVAIDRERVVEELSNEASTSGLPYFRLNPRGLENVGTLHWHKIKAISSDTVVYLGLHETKIHIKNIAQLLSNPSNQVGLNERGVHQAPGRPLTNPTPKQSTTTVEPWPRQEINMNRTRAIEWCLHDDASDIVPADSQEYHLKHRGRKKLS